MFNPPEWSVFFEQREADVLVMHNTSRFLAAIEIESTPRNVLRNIERDLANGCHAVATSTLQKRFHRQIENRIRKHHPDLIGTRIQIFPGNASGMARLVDWIEELVHIRAPHAAPVSTNPQNKENIP